MDALQVDLIGQCLHWTWEQATETSCWF